MLNENVVKLLKGGMWDLATCANGEPNVVPVAFKDVTPDGAGADLKKLFTDHVLEALFSDEVLREKEADARAYKRDHHQNQKPRGQQQKQRKQAEMVGTRSLTRTRGAGIAG